MIYVKQSHYYQAHFYCIEMKVYFSLIILTYHDRQLLILKHVRNYKGEIQTGSFDVQGQLFSDIELGLDLAVRMRRE